MARYLKAGKHTSSGFAVDPTVATAVGGYIEEIRREGIEAVRRLSTKFDRWSPEAFRLSEQEIERCIA